MAEINIPNTIVAGEEAQAAPVQANFDYIENALANDVIHKDGSKEFTGLPSVADGVADPSGDGDLVPKGFLDSRLQLVKRLQKFDGSNYAYGASWVDFGVSLSAFDWPEIPEGGEFTISLYVPEFYVGTYDGGQWPTQGLTLDVGLFLGSSTLIQKGGVVTTQINGFGPDAVASLYMERTYFNNDARAAGTSTTVKVAGRITSGGGKFKLQGTANAPIELKAKLH